MTTGHIAYSPLARDWSNPSDVGVISAPLTPTRPPALCGRIKAGEPVSLDGRLGVWRVVAFTRDGAQLVSLRSVTKTVLRGVEYKRLRRVTK
jgi:hypothetical protein